MKILFIVKERREYDQLFVTAAKSLGHQLTLAKPAEIAINFSGETDITVNKLPLDSFDVVYLRAVVDYLEHATLISRYCKQKNIPLVDPALQSYSPWVDSKSHECLLLIEAGLPTIPSWYISAQTLAQLPAPTYPMIAKQTSLSQGRGVFLCRTKSELKQLLDQHQFLLVQPFIENHGDIRIFVLGYKAIAAIKRIAAEGEFRNNVSQGARSEPYMPSHEEVALAEKAAQSMKYAIAGVDLIQDSTGKTYVMEVNRAPQFVGTMNATGVNIPKAIIEYLVDFASL